MIARHLRAIYVDASFRLSKKHIFQLVLNILIQVNSQAVVGISWECTLAGFIRFMAIALSRYA